ADSTDQESGQRAPQRTADTPYLETLFFIAIGDAEKIVALAPRPVQDGDLIHRKIMPDHFLDLRMCVISVVKYGNYKMMARPTHGYLSLCVKEIIRMSTRGNDP